MGGLFGVVSKEDCVTDLFYGTDYHSHLGTVRGGMAIRNGIGFDRHIHDISNAQFRSKFDRDITTMEGPSGIGAISDTDPQPLIISSHLGTFAIVTVAAIANVEALVRAAFDKGATHFSEMSHGEVNPTELVATLINQGSTFTEGIKLAQEAIEGSCSLLLLTADGLYAARDRLGRTPIVIGKKEGACAAASESCALPNIGYDVERFLGPGEIVRLTPDGVEQKQAPGEAMQICSFLWVYYGYPATDYEGINVEVARYRCGAALARRDDIEVDLVAGIPDSGSAHAIGYANEARVRYSRPFVKYTPTWPRSFMPQDQRARELVARMKLLPIRELVQGKRLLFCEDSIVRGTQLREIIAQLFDVGAVDIHMRPACPPLIYGCKFLNFSRSRSVMDLAGRRAIKELDGNADEPAAAYADPDSDEYAAMVDRIRLRLGLTTLKYQRLGDLVEAIGLPQEKLCTYCWDGVEPACGKTCPAAGKTPDPARNNEG